MLNLEGAAVLAAILWVYFFRIEGSWILFAGLLMAPDVALLGYVTRNNRVGAACYNASHTYLLPIAIVVSGVATELGHQRIEYLDSDVTVQIGLVLMAHIAMDRALGYGLKYATGPKPTHLQRA